MKQVLVVILGLVLLSACQVQHRTTPTLAPSTPQPPSPAVQPAAAPPQTATPAPLEQATALLRELTLNPATSLPDGLLNRTRCLVLGIPNRAEAVSSCRSADAPYQWSKPELLQWRGSQPAGTAPVLMILSERAANALMGGTLDLAKVKSSPGKTLAQARLLTERDLGYDVVTYSYSRGLLTGAPVTDVIQRSTPTERAETPGGGHEPAPPISGEYVNWVQSYFNAITPSGIIIHHSAIIPENGKVPKAFDDIDNYHAQRGMDIECFGKEYHVAYHYLIFPDGRVEPGRPERCEGAHARGYNSFIGISLMGDFSSADNPRGTKGPVRPSKRQLASLIRLTRELQAKYKIPVQRILRHSDVGSTLCPGDRFAFKSFLAALELPRT